MAYDIGPKIGIDGESEFRKQLNNITQNIKTLGSEMKVVTTAFDGNEDSIEALTAKQKVLEKQIDAVQQKIKMQAEATGRAAARFGESATETQKWQRALNESQAELNRLKSELSKTERAMSQLDAETDNMADGMKKAADATEKAGEKFSAFTVAAGNLISSGISAAVSAVGDMVSGLVNLDQTTEEYRTAMGKLNTAFEAAGYGTDTAQKAYTDLYAILGDTDTATEAAQLMAKLSTSAEDMGNWTAIAAGVAGTFGDALPIESLIEAANETAKVGQVTGTLADALNWAGISEDDFNQKLADASTETERNQLIMDTLSDTYRDAAEAFYENNDALIESRENQAALDEAMGGIGDSIANIKNNILSELLPAISALADGFSGLLTGETTVAEFAQTVGGIVSDIGQQIVANLPQLLTAGGEIVGQLGNAIVSALPEILETGKQILGMLADGIIHNIDNLVTTATDMIVFLADAIIEALPEMVRRLPEIIAAIVETLSENIPKIYKVAAELIGTLATSLLNELPNLLDRLPEMGQDILDGYSSALSNIADVGKDLVRGLWEGIQNMAEWIGERIRGFGEDVLEEIKAFFGIESPSKVFRDEVGVMLARGLAAGLEDGETYVLQTAEKIGLAIEEKILETQAALEAATEDSVKASLQTQLDALEEFRDEYSNALSDLAKKQLSMTDKLSDYGDLFERAEGELTLTDLQEQIDAIKGYGDALESLKTRGVSESLLGEIAALDNITEATDYTNKLLKMTGEEYEEYMALWEEKQAEANKVAAQFYSSELAALESEFVDKIPESMSGLKDELVQVGENAADGLAEGFASRAQAVISTFVSTAHQAVAAVNNSLGIHSPSTVFAGIGGYMAEGLGLGFERKMKGVSELMQNAIPTPQMSLGDAVSGVVNGMQTALSGVGGGLPSEITLIMKSDDGQRFGRWMVPFIRSEDKSNPEVVSDTL